LVLPTKTVFKRKTYWGLIVFHEIGIVEKGKEKALNETITRGVSPGKSRESRESALHIPSGMSRVAREGSRASSGDDRAIIGKA